MPGRPARGFSLVEIMVAITLGVIVLGGLGSIFIHGSRNANQDASISLMLDEMGFAMAELARDLEMAGYWARVHEPAGIRRHASLDVANDCGAVGEAWTFESLRPLTIVDNATAAEAQAAHRCLPQDAVLDGADVISVKRLEGHIAGTDTDSSGMLSGHAYLRSHGAAGVMYVRGSGTPGMPAPYAEWKYRPIVYYIQRYRISALEEPAIPTLCRMVLESDGGKPAYVRECLAQGVEEMQVEMGVDTDADGVANYFESDPDAAALNRAVSVRLYLRLRSVRADREYRNAKTYFAGNAEAFTPSGDQVHYYRKTVTTEVVLRNPRSLYGVAFQ